jgi:acetylornithine deacetylase
MIALLQKMIAIPSFSKEESGTADAIAGCLKEHGVAFERIGNNIVAYNQYYDSNLPLILLNSHHDTVQPVSGWTLNPFEPTITDGRLYGLGANDAGGALVSLMGTFLFFHAQQGLQYNLVLVASAEEEISGMGGISMVLPHLRKTPWLGIVGEPTGMHPAVAEKGLMVIAAYPKGKSGHAARNEGINALYLAIKDIEVLKNYQFGKISPWLGAVKVSVTQIQAGTQHNVVPDECHFVIDVRSNGCYSNIEVLEILQNLVNAVLTPRSLRLNASEISIEHPFVQLALAKGRVPYGSPTMSDQALLPFDTIKLGPGDSARSHTADEYIYTQEIEAAQALYILLLQGLMDAS